LLGLHIIRIQGGKDVNKEGQPTDVRDYIERYVEFQELLINGQAELDMLLAQQQRLIPSLDRGKTQELEVRITNARTYLGRIKQIVKDWGDALAALGQTYNKTEYEMFNVLIIRGIPPKKTKWAVGTCYNFRAKVFKDIARLERKEDE